MKQTLSILLSLTFALAAYPPAGTLHDIAVDFQGTFSILNDINRNFCSPSFITQADVGSTGLVINSPGIYKLGEDITFSPGSAANAITINADNVSLDLQCFSISQGNLQADVSGIRINPSLTNVSIKNGSINDFSYAGIIVAEDNYETSLRGIQFVGNNQGILLDGNLNSPIIRPQLENLELINSMTAISMINVQQSITQNILALQSTQAGIDIQQSFTNSLNHIAIKNVTSVNNAYGIKLNNGAQNQISNSSIREIISSSAANTDTAAGIELGLNEASATIHETHINGVTATNAVQPFGINTPYSFTTITPKVETVNAGANNLSAWSPDGRYLASIANNLLQVFEFNHRNELILIADVTVAPSNGSSIDWSPDGRYIVTGYSFSGIDRIQIHEFTGSRLIVVAFANPSSPVQSVNWSPNGAFIASSNNNEVTIYRFNTPVLEVAATVAISTAFSVQWSPDSRFIVTGIQTGFLPDVSDMRVYEFTGTALTNLVSANLGTVVGRQFKWSPDGRYIAVVGNVGVPAEGRIGIYQFRNGSLSTVTGFTTPVASSFGISITWSPDGRYVAVGLIDNIPNLQVYRFFNNALMLIAGSTESSSSTTSTSWSPNGQFIAATEDSNIGIWPALQFVTGHTITNNIIAEINGPALPADFSNVPATSSGRGIQATSNNTTILSNNLSKNDISYTFVGSEQFRMNTINIKEKNESANPLSNTSSNADYDFARNR